jgi:branched-chain amino acid transport system substrate-binding protein
MTQSARQKNSPPPIVFIASGLMLVVCAFWAKSNFKIGWPLSDPPSLKNMSLGQKALVLAEMTPDKEEGIQAFAAGDYDTAIAKFDAHLKRRPNDPEARVYLNNAKIGDRMHLLIAVSIPISSNLNVAQEILRGVSQVQDELNKERGIKGLPLKVEIIDDKNDPKIAKQVAAALVDDPKVFAVVGHNTSDASLAAVPIYEQGKLVMISPTSTATSLSGAGNYIFRTVPSVNFLASGLAQYAIKTAHKTKIAVCFDGQAKDNLSFKNEFIAAFETLGGRIAPINCDFASSTFDPSISASQAISSGADSILLAPHVDRADRALNIAQAVKGKLPLFGSPTLYTHNTVQTGAQDVNGLILITPWHPSHFATNPLAIRARQLWGGEINWRTATAIDATRAISAALQSTSDPTREGLQQTLRSPQFSATGAGEAIRFLPTGDRVSSPVLIQVRPDARAQAKFSFMTLNR